MKEKGYQLGGENDLDGDYYRAYWIKTGVLEADCLICHLPGYHYEERNRQIKFFNFRWAATAGAGFAEITGSVKKGETPKVRYDLRWFDAQGRVRLPIVKEVPRQNCLFCHKESDYKKRGASYKGRDGVHARAGLRCVDCHWAGSRAKNQKIAGLELHEIGKGDDPGGHVRDDLDNTVRPCLDCHAKGTQGAPKALHRGFPPRHLEKIACQTCHIPYRAVKAALIQDATHFNPAPEIFPPPKRIWTFYGPDAKPWNYYGELHREGIVYQRPFTYVPLKAWYKGKIWPINRVHSAWVGIIRPRTPGIDMVFMLDFFKMWMVHVGDPQNKFPQLKEIRDDNGDGVLEVNRPAEVKALLSAVKSYLSAKGKLGHEDRVVFVNDAAYTEDGKSWIPLEKFPWEATPYASVFKYSHDIYPAKAALGSTGCTDCHSRKSSFFFRPVLASLWDEEGNFHYEPNYQLLGYSKTAVFSGALRQEVLEPVLYYGFILTFLVLGFGLVLSRVFFNLEGLSTLPASSIGRLSILVLSLAFFGPALTVVLGRFFSSATLGHFALIHKWAGVLGLLAAIYLFLTVKRKSAAFILGIFLFFYQAITGGVLFFVGSANLRQIVFTLHDLGALFLIALAGGVIFTKSLKREG